MGCASSTDMHFSTKGQYTCEERTIPANGRGRPLRGAAAGSIVASSRAGGTAFAASRVPREPETCPICCEVKTDVEVLDHWMPKGDVSGHRMCGRCRRNCVQNRNQCPFCKEIVIKDEILKFISDFVDAVSSRARSGDPNQMAAVLERWQLFEMEFEGQPEVIRRVAKLVVEDPSFSAKLQLGVKKRQDWLRDTAGIIFRFHGMYREGELVLDAVHGKRLDAAVEAIMEPFERARPVTLDGHFYGALYMQALLPWLCAWRAGMASEALKATLQRVGRAVVHCYKAFGSKPTLRHRVTERIHQEYVAMAHTPVWGSREEDVVWKAFFA